MPAMISGVEVETVGDILGDVPGEFLEVDGPLEMPKITGTPDELPPGIHFHFPEEAYHNLPHFSCSYLRAMLSSPTLMWAESWINPHKEYKSAEHYIVGHAYHAMILEGPDAYNARFYPAPDPAQHPKALRTADEIKEALKDRDLKPVTRVDIIGKNGEPTTRPAVKADHVAQLVEADRSIEVWDHIVERARRHAAGRAFLSVDDDRRIRIAARMIAMDPQLAKAFKGGWPEVTLVWRDPRQGVLMKARIDYLKTKAIIDLKSFVNQKKLSVRKAITRTIAERAYSLQPAVYTQGVDEVRKLVRAHGASAIHVHGEDWTAADISERVEWALRWAQFDGPDRWLWVWQQKGDAPVTRGFYHPLAGSLHSIAQTMFVDGLRRFRQAAETFGTDPWLDLAEIDELDESELPAWGLDI
jgi:hypothetical protein